MLTQPHNWRDGLQRAPLHLLTFGMLGLLGTWYGGWGCAVTLLAWRIYAEYRDWMDLKDTLPKALIDLATQSLPALLVVLVRLS